MKTFAVPEKITTISQLVRALKNNPSDKSYLHVLQSIAIPLREYEKFYTWNKERYTRNCLVRTADFELLLICWEKGQSSTIQDYDTNEAWIHPIQGKLKEEKYRSTDSGLEIVSAVILGNTEFSYMAAPMAMHRYINIYEARTVSLNLYARPLEKRNEYDEKTGEVVEESVSYDVVYQFDDDGNVLSF